MFKMPNLLTTFIKDFLISSIIFIFSLNYCLGQKNNFPINHWIEGIPIFSNLIESKLDVTEFDSSNGKIISITFDSNVSGKKNIYKFYEKFFENSNWKKIDKKNIWEKEILGLRKKTFKIELLQNDTLLFKIITENF